jgi:hypothetical protein
MEQKIIDFYKENTFRHMESAYKRGYNEAAQNGLLNQEQIDWALAVHPVWDPVEETDLKRHIADALLLIENIANPGNPNHDPNVMKQWQDPNLQIFVNEYNAIPVGYSIEKILELFKKNPEKLGIIIQYMYSISPSVALAIYNSMNAVDYKNGKNKINPIFLNKKNIFGQGADKVKKYSENYLGKYISKRMRNKMPNIARAIFDEISAQKIKPTDGLGGLLKKADDIKKNLPAAAAGKFDIMLRALKDVSETDQFKKALKSGRAMNALQDDLAEWGGDNDKVEEIKQLQFILNGISYGATTSSIRGRLRENKLTIFSDAGMSWMKHDVMKFMATATDKVLNLGFMLSFEIANFAKNKIRGGRSKFSPKSWYNKKSVRDIEEAQRFISANPGISKVALQAEAATARNDANNAKLLGAKDAPQREKDAQKKELRVEAKEQEEARNLGLTNSKLHRKLQLMAHWDMLRSGKTNDLSLESGNVELGHHGRGEKKFFNSPQGVSSQYQNIWANQVANWNNGIGA